MNHTPIRLIALDLDGTLFNFDFAFSPRVKRAIAQAQQRGIASRLSATRGG